MAASPSSVSVVQGSTATSTISTSVTSGSAQTVTLSASGLPAGAGASFNPASVTAGGSSTMTITAGASTPAGTSTVTVTGTATSGTHTTPVSVTVTAPVTNDFSIAASPSSVSVVQGSSTTSAISTAVTSGAAQNVSLSAGGLPAGAAASFNPTSVAAGGSSTLTIATAASTPAGTSTVTVTGTGASATHSTTVSLTVTAPVVSGTVTNGGFESGFTGWATSGASETVVSPGHTGNNAARLGNTVATNGNSTMQQTITNVPANATLSFWYNPHCPDTLTYDQQQVQIRNTAGTTLATVLNVCDNSGVWKSGSASLASYSGQTIVLWFNSHDDNYASDPTYVVFDDIAITAGPVVNDFSMAAAPSSLTVVQGQGGTSTISTAVTSGAAQAVSLSAAGQPSGVGTSFNPASVNAGGSATLSITTTAATAPGTYIITVTGTGASNTHSTTVSLTVTAAGGGGGGTVTNGGFESGFAGWTTAGASETVVSPGHTGTSSARLGNTVATNGNSTMQQTISGVPAYATLTYWYNPHCPDTLTYDQQQVQIRNTAGATLATVMNVCDNSGVWKSTSVSLSAYSGQTIVLWFNSHDDNYASDPTYVLFDDIAITHP